jgi:hypothetical protein
VEEDQKCDWEEIAERKAKEIQNAVQLAEVDDYLNVLPR